MTKENNNNDLISREALKKRLNEMFETFDVVLFDDIIATIDNAPTVDTACPHCDSGYVQGYSDGYLRGKEERPQGEWVLMYCSCGDRYYTCSICNRAIEVKNGQSLKDYPFCHCGADMQKGGAE